MFHFASIVWWGRKQRGSQCVYQKGLDTFFRRLQLPSAECTAYILNLQACITKAEGSTIRRTLCHSHLAVSVRIDSSRPNLQPRGWHTLHMLSHGSIVSVYNCLKRLNGLELCWKGSNCKDDSWQMITISFDLTSYWGHTYFWRDHHIMLH